MLPKLLTHTSTRTLIHAGAHTYTHKHIHIHAHIQTYTHVHTILTHTTHTHTHSLSLSLSLTHTHTHTRTCHSNTTKKTLFQYCWFLLRHLLVIPFVYVFISSLLLHKSKPEQNKKKHIFIHIFSAGGWRWLVTDCGEWRCGAALSFFWNICSRFFSVLYFCLVKLYTVLVGWLG